MKNNTHKLWIMRDSSKPFNPIVGGVEGGVRGRVIWLKARLRQHGVSWTKETHGVGDVVALAEWNGFTIEESDYR